MDSLMQLINKLCDANTREMPRFPKKYKRIGCGSDAHVFHPRIKSSSETDEEYESSEPERFVSRIISVEIYQKDVAKFEMMNTIDPMNIYSLKYLTTYNIDDNENYKNMVIEYGGKSIFDIFLHQRNCIPFEKLYSEYIRILYGIYDMKQKNVLHQDVHNQNVVYSEDTKKLKIIDYQRIDKINQIVKCLANDPDFDNFTLKGTTHQKKNIDEWLFHYCRIFMFSFVTMRFEIVNTDTIPWFHNIEQLKSIFTSWYTKRYYRNTVRNSTAREYFEKHFPTDKKLMNNFQHMWNLYVNSTPLERDIIDKYLIIINEVCYVGSVQMQFIQYDTNLDRVQKMCEFVEKCSCVNALQQLTIEEAIVEYAKFLTELHIDIPCDLTSKLSHILETTVVVENKDLNYMKQYVKN